MLVLTDGDKRDLLQMTVESIQVFNHLHRVQICICMLTD